MQMLAELDPELFILFNMQVLHMTQIHRFNTEHTNHSAN